MIVLLQRRCYSSHGSRRGRSKLTPGGSREESDGGYAFRASSPRQDAASFNGTSKHTSGGARKADGRIAPGDAWDNPGASSAWEASAAFAEAVSEMATACRKVSTAIRTTAPPAKTLNPLPVSMSPPGAFGGRTTISAWSI